MSYGSDSRVLAEQIKAIARRVEFDLVGISPVAPPSHGLFFADWLRQGFAGEMEYLTRGEGKRLHPGAWLPWARSIVSVAVNYFTPFHRTELRPGVTGWIARYAWGEDYHQVLERRLDQLLAEIRREVGGSVQGRAYVDTGPVLERDHGSLAGIGWIGKNTTLIHPRRGSWFFLGELFLDLDLEPDVPIQNRCGACDLCIQACPTGALVGPYLLDARRCISYLTIELKGSIPRQLRPLMGTHIFGCDICQDVCPYNAKATPTREEGFWPRRGFYVPELIPLMELTEEEFSRRFRGSPIKRAKRRGLLRNVAVALGNLRAPEAVPVLARAALMEGEALIREHAAWGLGRIRTEAAVEALEQARRVEADPVVRAEIEQSLAEAVALAPL
ncbi:MAG: tRNA epoxyqueuosine(34) reductase QueG [Candidatus Methylomirabilales bacterium]